jgi:hypothetical protein
MQELFINIGIRAGIGYFALLSMVAEAVLTILDRRLAGEKACGRRKTTPV